MEGNKKEDLISRSALQYNFDKKCRGECGCCEYARYTGADGRREYGCALINDAPAVEAAPAEDKETALLKPLTLDEARELRICWIEEIDAEEIGWELFPAIWLHKGLDGRYDLFAIETEIDNICSFKVAEYGINWRCWSRKPTDEESRAAEWE